MITENLKDVEARVCAACERSGRKREDVTLIGGKIISNEDSKNAQ